MSEPATAPNRVAAVVYNPVKVDLDALREIVAREEQAAGWDTSVWFETSVDDPGQGATRDALDAGADMILAAGGDGTVRAVAEAIGDSQTPLALLPSGTGNLLARNLELTLEDLDRSVHDAFTGTDRRVDVATIEITRPDSTVARHSYVVMAGVGLDASMLQNTDDDLKKKVGWLAYVGAAVTSLKGRNHVRLQMSVDGAEPESVKAHTVIVGNCGSLQANVRLLPDAALDDGLLDVVVMRPENLVGWIQVLTKIVWENGVLSRTPFGRRFRTKDVRALEYVRGSTITVELSEPEQIELDGDGFGEATAFTTWVDHEHLVVRVPMAGPSGR
ncbi:diacylglycerol/lipid kinase family protein [Sanguibacter antarcticus]|uniref:Diacylglycerol kinase family enzyme n=1 Tax=Sanguibacter antarcticus TaxID=372484 RepID=A0A2A9E9I5_9MICO|nr:diacylglycerol kinase family protein [Sanguibacter antarcticus]PFG34840.1 diacylglycerol kinase family enzyme [Sanguibacter antarcticus]